jgi:signal transduction histidine kinase/DNA-binding response OmpR family regulator/HPt (histidine-containing phosphotransfer) domain-containing protein
MKIKPKTNLFILFIVVGTALPLVVAGYLTINQIIIADSTTMLSRELAHIDLNIRHSHSELERAGLLNLESYVEAEKQQVLGVLANYNFGQTGRLHVFTRQGETVKYSETTGDKGIVIPLARIIDRKSGTFRFAHGSHYHFGVFQATTHWDWVIVLSVAEYELFASRNFYLKLVLVFFLLILGVVMVLSTMIAGSFRQRIDTIVGNIKQAEQGNLNPSEAPIPADELGEIQRGFNAMISTVAAHANALETAKEQAEAANRAKSEFLARMSHEIRTPLSAVTGLTQVVLKSDLSGDQRDFLEKVLIASDNLMQVINDVLDFSKVEAGQLALTPTVFDLDLMLEDLADLFSNRVSQKDIELIFFKSPQVPRVLKGDAGRLNQVLTNLIENAIKFTETGEVFMGVESDGETGPPRERVVLKFRVSDTGMGIDADVLPTLFDPFIQADSSLTREREGTGLGLTICRSLVGLMDGRIWAESTPDKGSTFYFTALLETQKRDAPRFSIPPDIQGLKALVVDDSDTSRQLFEDLLASFSFDVTSVDSGEKAVEALNRDGAQSPYQLVLLDWKMPGLDGIDTARHIREMESKLQASRLGAQIAAAFPDPAIGRTPTPISSGPGTMGHDHKTPMIILVTAYGLELMQERIDMAPVDTYLVKPVKPSQLFNTIMEMFGRTDAVLPQFKEKRTEYYPPLAGRRVLVVEDSPLNRDVAVALLEEEGPVVETAEDGRVAVKKVTSAPVGYFDAVLMDIQMPLMDGYEATRLIRAWEFEVQRAAFKADESTPASVQPETRNRETGTKLPIIALTAHALKGEKEKCLAAGMDDYITKPIDEHHLRRVLFKWIAPQKEREDSMQELRDSGPSDNPDALDVQGALKRLGGRKHIYLKVIGKFMPEFGKAPEVITDYLAVGDRVSAERAAHSLKGAAAAIGAMALSQAAAKTEKTIAAKAPDWQAALGLVKKELETVGSEISAYLDKEAGTIQSVSPPP